MKTQTIEVRDLKPGMVIRYTRDEIVSHPTSGISTSKNKMDFIVKTPKGAMIQKSWNRHTLVAIITE